jgi:hypothetical protein
MTPNARCADSEIDLNGRSARAVVPRVGGVVILGLEFEIKGGPVK